MKTEAEVYGDIQDYVNSSKHNRPCTLASIKKALRTPPVIDLIFSRPDIFQLEKEIVNVPDEYRSERILIQFVLDNPKRLSLLSEDEQTLPVLIAFGLSKLRYEQQSASECMRWGEKIPYLGKSENYRDTISTHCKNISTIMKETLSLTEMTELLQEYCSLNKAELKPDEKYERKYTNIDLKTQNGLFILVSGIPDSGKTFFASVLSKAFKNAIYFDSDMLTDRNWSTAPFDFSLYKVVVFSDPASHRFFKKYDTGKAEIINIFVKPCSLEEMHRHSKYECHIPFEKFAEDKERQINVLLADIPNPIVVQNDYTKKTFKEVDRAIEEIAKRLNLELSQKSTMDIINAIRPAENANRETNASGQVGGGQPSGR